MPATGAAAQDSYPTRPITIIVPTAPGGGNDAMARILAQKMGGTLEQTIVVENKPGANGAIASQYVAREKPDGYTILFGYIATHAINPSMRKLRYDPVADFSAIGEVATSPTLMVINKDVPAKNVQELIALSRQAGSHMNYASAGSGTAPHAAGALFKQATGAHMQDIPYKGSNPAMMDTIAGTTQVMFPSLFSAEPHIKDGSVRALAVAGEKRSPVFPDLPTLKEQGIDVAVDQWYALFAPKATPAPIVAKLNQALNEALTDPDVKAKFVAQGATVQPSTPAELEHLVEHDLKKWKTVVAETGMNVN
jgi:tripartite-type tricarboxylate transporter receptor subunit TctC